MSALPEAVLKSYFKKYDTDGSGTIGKTELCSLAYDLGVHIEHEGIAFKALDTDDSGKVTFEEFARWFNDVSMFGSSGSATEVLEACDAYPEWMEWLIATFRYYDTDKTGTITAAEFQKLCEDYPFSKPPSWKEVDADGDGQCELNEFMKWVWDNYDHFTGETS
mmetsp:Transcript_97654/g.172992  ORF Transcript_97654/g.172992 Transcript_97654/m.172992 type:complete len:164 (+) Transcript_97654:99-590(+)